MFDYFASSPRYVEDLLAHELAEFGAQDVQISHGGVFFKGNLEVGLRACLWSRIASRVLLELRQFPMEKEEQLYDTLVEYPWESLFTLDDSFACRFTAKGRAPMDPRMGSLHIKDAIADRFRKVKDLRPDVDRDNPDLRISGHWEKDHCRIYLDLSGEPLSVRNYRKDAGEAPLRENLAAALLLRSNWPEMAAEGAGFWDPLCGSGTLVIEALLMAADQAPGLKRRKWGFTRWQGFEESLWEDLLEEARQRAEKGRENLPVIGGSDRDFRVLRKAGENARRAGFDLPFIESSLEELPEKLPELPEEGLILTNPPYGVRLEERSGLEELYAAIGRFYRERLPFWNLSLITTEKELSFATGLKADKVHRFDNGSLPCQLCHFTDPIQNRFVFHISDSGEQFKNRLEKNWKRISRWARKNDVSCFRLYDADLPDYNFAVDFYEGRWVNLQEYVPPVPIDFKKSDKRLKEAVYVISEMLEIPRASVFIKQRKRQKGNNQYDRQDKTGERYRIKENGYACWANFQDYLDTGIFLDHRPVRNWIKENAADKWVLNLFCYTATGSVAAAVGGARLTVSVDTSSTYLDWGQDNFRLNRLKPEEHDFIRADVMSWLEKERRRYHLIFVDPPTFSNNSTQKRNFDIQKDHIKLLNLCYRRLRPGGQIVFSNNFRTFEMKYTPRDGEIEEVTDWSIPEDFRRSKRIHRCWFIKKPLK